MKELKTRILKDGKCLPGGILKVDNFINHQMDVKLFRDMGKEWKRRFAEKDINKILTIEASGIGIAAVVALEFDVPVVFAKKSSHKNVGNDVFKAQSHSFTHGKDYEMIVSKKYLNENVGRFKKY